MLLLDTHVFLWLRFSPERIRRSTRERLEEAGSELTFSSASGWEIALKHAAGRIPLPAPVRTWLPEAIADLRCDLLSLDLDHAVEAALLPRHHRDPVDRYLVAQARVEGLTLVTADRRLAAYDVEILRA